MPQWIIDLLLIAAATGAFRCALLLERIERQLGALSGMHGKLTRAVELLDATYNCVSPMARDIGRMAQKDLLLDDEDA